MNNRIKEVLDVLDIPESGMVFRKINDEYWGRNSEGFVVYGDKAVDNPRAIIESTKSLTLYLNAYCEVVENNNTSIERLNIIILKKTEYLDIFINLTEVYNLNKEKYSFLQFFMYLKDLFSYDAKSGSIQVQGLYAELYTIYYFKEYYDFDLSNYYQSKSKMKFDFSIDSKRKIDVKSTTKEERIHHFKNEQLNTLRYDIKIVSILLLADDRGLTLYDLIERCKTAFSNNFLIQIYIEKIKKSISIDELKLTAYNENYIIDNIKVFDALNIPRISEKNDEGIFNIEYDSNLTTAENLSSDDFINWASGE
ncbi:MAG: hypothetical protein ACOX28_01575 [Bacilli bacterium]|jgi:hypothetical protein